MIPLWALQFLAGGLGGLVRGILGIYKNYSSNPQTFKFDAKYLGITLFVSMIVGQLAGVVFNGDWRSSLLAGYAGSDFLEGLFKLRFSNLLKT